MRGVYRKFWIVLLSAFGLMLLMIPAGRAVQGGISYASEAVIIYRKPEQKQIDTQGSSFVLRPLSQDTLVDMFLSRENIRELEQDVGLQPLEQNVAFDTGSKSDIVTLQISGMPSEEQAIETANTLAEIIIENNAAYYHQLAETAYENFREQRIAAEKEYRRAVDAVEEFQLENGVIEINTQYDNYFSSVNAAEERLSIAKVAHEGLLVRIRNYEQIIQDLPEEVLSESLEDSPLKRRISNAEAALLDARIQYGPENPKVLRQERELEELRKLLRSGSFDETRERTYVKNPLKEQIEGELVKLRAEEEVAKQQVESLRSDLNTLQQRFKELPRLEKEYAALLEQRADLDATLTALRANEEAARRTMESSLSDFKLMNPADRAESSGVSLIGKVIPIAGFILGFFGGLVVVLGIELLDAKIRTQQKLENAYDAPCLASIIEIPNLAAYDTYSLLLPSLREISERLNVVLSGQRAKVLGFFSTQDDEGKSVLSFNLARYYSSLGIKTLFVGFDARPNPCLPDAGDLGWPQRGIEEYLRGRAKLEDMVASFNEVDVIRVQESGDLMDEAKGAAMPRLWDLLRQNYDLIITEAPGVLDHPVSGTLAGFVDEIIYVLASPVSDRRLADAGLEFLEDRGLAPRALIFNRVDPYYLEDIRQQRIIRNLAEHRTAAPSFADRFRRVFGERGRSAAEPPPAEPAAGPAPAEPAEPPPAEPVPDLIDDDEDLPETIGGDEPREPAPPQPPEKPAGKSGTGLSYREWLGDPDNRTDTEADEDADTDEK